MEKVQITNLTQGEQKAVEAARKARLNAVPPVSNFYVGAAVLSKNNNIHPGANIEEAALNGTIHAEPSAISGANARGDRDISVLAICGQSEDNLYPCLHCWQFICNYAEILGHPIKIISVFPEGDEAVIFDTQIKTISFLKFSDIGSDLSKLK